MTVDHFFDDSSKPAVELDGVRVVSFQGLISRMAAAYPHISRGEIETIALREYEAFTGGVPLAVPALLEEGLHEMMTTSLPQELAG